MHYTEEVCIHHYAKFLHNIGLHIFVIAIAEKQYYRKLPINQIKQLK